MLDEIKEALEIIEGIVGIYNVSLSDRVTLSLQLLQLSQLKRIATALETLVGERVIN